MRNIRMMTESCYKNMHVSHSAHAILSLRGYTNFVQICAYSLFLSLLHSQTLMPFNGSAVCAASLAGAK